MTFSALDSALLGPLFATAAMRAAFSDQARLAAMLEAEAALARVQARFGLVPEALHEAASLAQSLVVDARPVVCRRGGGTAEPAAQAGDRARTGRAGGR